MKGSNSKMTDAEAKTFGSELKRLRKEAGLSAEAFGELCGRSYIHIYGIENGKRKPSPELAERIADVFNTTVEDMLGETKAAEASDEEVWAFRRKYGRKLFVARQAKGLSVRTVAGALGILPSVYKEYEEGTCSITDREMDVLNKLLGIGEKPKVEVVKEAVEVPAEIPERICDLILGHVKDLQISEDEQKEVWRYFNQVRLDAEERRLFG